MTQGKIQTVRRLTWRQAAPEGGARIRLRLWVWGCLIFPLLPIQTVNAADVPSGQPVALMEIRSDVMGAETWLRFRFLATDLANEARAVEAVVADMEYLCGTVAVEHVAATGGEASRVVISLSDREMAFGETNKKGVQFFDAFRISDGRCIWEGF